jgi:cytochrome c oxidase subunit II
LAAYKTDNKMGFLKNINSKKLFSLLAVFMLSGTTLLMAQTSESGPTTPTEAAAADKGAVWLGAGYYVLLFLVVCFAIGIIGKVLKVYDLTQQIQNKKPFNWNGFMGAICIVFLIAGLYGAYWSFTEQGTQILPEAASVHGVKMDEMFGVTTGITMVVFFITQILLFTFLFRYQYKKKRKAYYLPHNNTIEKVWTIAPAIVLTVLVVFGFFSWQEFTNTTPEKGDLNIELTGHQFAWEIRYPGKDGVLGRINYQLYTANNYLGVDFQDKNSFDDLRADTIVLPVNHSIRLNIRAQDVIHSCYMPNFRVQMNAVPGLPTFFKFIPTITTAEMRQKLDQPDFEYMLYCNKICGGAHYNMKRIVRVVTEAEYQQWIAQQKPYLTDALKKDLKLAGTTAPNSTSSANKLALNN